MKVRIGIGTGGAGLTLEALDGLVDGLDKWGFDSLWLSDVLTSPGLDPLVGLAWAAARSPRLKLGTTMLLPGRNVLRLAKELATLDIVSAGRALITFVPGLTMEPERSAIGVEPKRRGAVMDEVLPVLRRLWAGETVTYQGFGGTFEGVTLAPLPVQQPLEAWLGGMTPAALERCGRLSDGWLPSLCTPDEAAEGKRVIDAAAAAAGRAISPEHFGISIGYSQRPLDAAALAAMAARSRGKDPRTMVPIGTASLRTTLEQFLDVGFSKFVLRPMGRPESWPLELEELAAGVGDLQT